MRLSILLTTILFILSTSFCYSQLIPAKSKLETKINILIESHRLDASTFVEQSELDTLIPAAGGGACPSAMAINTLQILRSLSGEDKIHNPHKLALAAFKKHPKLLLGRVDNVLFEELLKYYENFLMNSKLEIKTSSSPSFRREDHKWDTAKGPDLSLQDQSVTIISFTLFDNNVEVGRHFVMIKKVEGKNIFVFDPKDPLKEKSYELEYLKNDNGEIHRVLLKPPPKVARKEIVLELNSVFHVRLVESAEAVSLSSIKNGIDKTFETLEDSSDRVSPLAWRKKTSSFGLTGLDMPKDLGGSAFNASQMLEVFKHAGRYNLNYRDIVGGAHSRPLLISKDPFVVDVLKQVVSGDAYIAICITEPDTGSDFKAMTSTAKKIDGGFNLNIHKRYVARLEQATHLLVFTKSTLGNERSLSAFLIPKNSIVKKGIKSFKAHGLLGNSFGELILEEFFVKDSQLIGEDGKADELFSTHFKYWRLMQAAAALGTGERALEMMSQRLTSRKAYGDYIGRFTHLQQPLGQHYTEIQMAYSHAQKAARLLDEGRYEEADALINGIKAEGVEFAIKAVDAAARTFGAEGYTDRVDIGERLRDLNGLRIADGTTDVMRMDVVRQKFNKELWNLGVRGKKTPD